MLDQPPRAAFSFLGVCMDFSTIAGFGGSVCGVAGMAFGWLVRRAVAQNDKRIDDLSGENKLLRTALDAHKLHVAEHYVTQNELTKAVESLDKTMQRVLDAITENAKEAREALAEIHRRIDAKADK